MDDQVLPDHLALANIAAALFPAGAVERTSDLVQMDLGLREEGTVPLLFVPDALEVRHRVVVWRGPHTPVLGSRLWKRVKYTRLDERRLQKFVADAKAAWTTRLQICSRCGEAFPPERVVEIDEGVCCHGCGERHEGVVF